MNITIELKVSDEILNVLRKILPLIQSVAHEGQEKDLWSAKEPVNASQAGNPNDPTKEPPALEEVRQIASQAAKKDRKRCFEIIQSYGAKNLTELPADKRADFLDRIMEILSDE